MLLDKIIQLIESGENQNVEFKECRHNLNKNIYETVCAFFNRSGGELLLGVNNSGAITGIDEHSIDQIKADFITSMAIFRQN